MNKILQQKVEDKCKDMGLSKEYVAAILAKMSSTVTDDSTDESAIETVANQIAEVAKLSQGEAHRWVNAYKAKQEPPKPEPPKPTPPNPEPPKPEPPKPEPPKNDESELLKEFRTYREEQEKRIKALEDQNAALAAERAKAQRTASINAAFDKHKIPEQLREFVNVPESVNDDGIDGFVAGMAQKIVTLQLPKLHSSVQTQGGEVTKEQTDAIAKAMLPGFAKKEEK